MSKSLGDVVDAALMEIGEGTITEFTTGNILHRRLIDAANNALREIMDRFDPDWGLKRTTIATKADITGNAAVTDGSTTVTSVDSDGANADSFTGVSTSFWFRGAATQKSYALSAVDVLSSPDTVTLETDWIDSTATALSYRMFQDTYAITDTDFGLLRIVSYGDALTWNMGVGGALPDGTIAIVPLASIYNRVGGDIHRNTTGRPQVIAPISSDSSDNPRFVLWPYPTKEYLIEVWYEIQYSENTTFGTNLFDGDAPLSAYDAVEHAVVSAACKWDQDNAGAAVFQQKFQTALGNLIRRENRERNQVGFRVETYRRQYGSRYPVRSGILFDTVRRR
jgi:hypothetical protein